MAVWLQNAGIWLLIGVHLVLAGWGVVGLVELFSGSVPWPRVSNELFSSRMLLMQWVLVLLTAFVFLAGYAAGWPRMPVMLAIMYLILALVCAYQTFFILEHDSRFVAMGVEYIAYIAILAFLFNAPVVQDRLQHSA